MKTMKKILILLATAVAFSSCTKSGAGDSTGCWICNIEGDYHGKVIDVDTSICNMNQAQINEFMAPYNAGGQIAVCNRKPF